MAQIFHPSTNTLSRLSIFGAVFVLAALLWLFAAIERSPYLTQADVVRQQPVPFSHKHHVNGLGIDCRYCHTTVEEIGICWHSVHENLYDVSQSDLGREPNAGARTGQFPYRHVDSLDARERFAGFRLL